MAEPGLRIRLPEDLLQKLRDESYQKSQGGKRVSMNDLVVLALREHYDRQN